MAIKAKISVDNSELVQGLQQAENQAKKTGKSINDGFGNNGGIAALDQLGKNADDAVRALDGVAGAAGAASTGLGGLAGDIISLVKNPIALLIAAFATLIAVGVECWKRLTVSAEEYKAMMDKQIADSQRNIKEQKKEADTLDIISKKLVELNNIQNKTASQYSLERGLIHMLSETYGDLGLSIDSTTGKYSNLFDVLLKLQNLELHRQQNALEDDSTLKNKRAHVLTSNNLIKELGAGAKNGKTVVIVGSGGDAEELRSPRFKGFDVFQTPEAQNMGYDIQFNTDELKKYPGVFSQEYIDMMEAWNNSSMAADKFKGKIKFLQYMEAKYAADTEMADKFTELKKAFIEAAEAGEAYENFVKYGQTTKPDTVNYFSKLTDEFTKGERDNQRLEEESKLKRRNIDRSTNYSLYAKGDKNQEIKELSKDQAFYQKYYDAAEAEYEKAEKQYKDALSQLYNLIADIKSGKIKDNSPEAMKAHELIRGNLQRATVAKNDALANLDAEYERLTINSNKITALLHEEIALYEDKTNSLKQEIDLTKLLIQGEDEKISKLKLINDIKSKGWKVDKEKIDEIIKKQRQLGALTLQNSMKTSSESLELQAMKLAGMDKKAMELEALRNAEKTKGSKLTKREIDNVKELTKLQHELDNTDLNLRLHGTLTNDLARRGGFNSSIISDSRSSINEQIRNNGRTANQLLAEIRDYTKKNGVIQ